MRHVALSALLGVLGCHTTAAPVDAGADLAVAAPAPADLAPPPSATYLLSLDAGAFPPGPHPSALVYIPTGYDPTPPLSIVVYLHGFSNCVENVVRDAGASCDRDAGTPPRPAYALAAQLEAAHKNALLVCPEVAFDQRTGDPGRLGTPGGFRALLAETLADLSHPLGGAGVDDVGAVVVASHSGGYQAAGAIVARGGVPVAELYLLDSLYGDTADFDAFARQRGDGGRFADLYTTGGGTLANSQAMADRARAQAWVAPAELSDERTGAPLPDGGLGHALVFRLTAVAHDAVPAQFFGPLLASSLLPDKR
jgi:hypothetical protein